jgi:hypothetical protein
VVQAVDEIRPLYTTIRVLGGVAIVILVAGFFELIAFEPPGQHTGTQAAITGVYAFDADTGQTAGGASDHFGRDQAFAAVIAWDRLPPTMVVAARWYNSLDQEVGGVGPATAAELAAQNALVVERSSTDLKHNLPGHYSLIVVRYAGGQPVEVIGRKVVLVETGA